MGKLYFRVAADYQEVIRLREEIDKLKASLLSLDSTTSKSEIKKLESNLKSATKRMEELVMSAAKAAVTLESELSAGANKSAESMKALAENQKSSSAKQMGYVDSLILKLAELEKAYRGLPEGADASAIIAEFNKTKSALDTVGKSIKDNIKINTIDVHPFHLVETSISDIQSKIKALNDYKVTIPIDRLSQIQAVEAQVERLKGTLSSLGKLSFSDVLSMPENSIGDISSKIKSIESVKARLNIDSTDITKANSEVERLKSIIKEVNAATIVPQKSFTEVMGMSEGSLNEISAKLREIARLKGGADITDTSRESSISSIYREEQALLSLQKEKMNEIKVNNLAEGSVLQLRAQLSLLTASYDAMSGEIRKSSVGDALLADISKTSTELSKAEELSQRFQRNVGNYKSGFNGIQFQVNQLVRELPSAAYGINVLISAVSNNYPMLIDEINKAKAANEALKVSGQTGTPIWKQIAGALFSWQTGLLLLTTYLIMNWKQVQTWVSGLFDAKNAAKLTGDEVKDMYKSFANSAGNELGKLNSLVDRLKSTRRGTDEWYSARSKLLSQYPDVFKGMDIENIKYGQLDANIRQVTRSILDKARADALSSTSSKIASTAIEKQQGKYEDIYSELAGKYDKSTADKYFNIIRSSLESGAKTLTPETQKIVDSFNYVFEQRGSKRLEKNSTFRRTIEDIQKVQSDAIEKQKQAEKMLAPLFAEEGAKGLQLLTDRRKALQDQYNKIAPPDLNSKDAKSLFNQIKKLDDEIDKYNVSKTDKANQKSQEQINSEKVAADERAKKIKENNEKLKLAAESSETDLSEAKMAAMDEGYAKEKAKIDANFKKAQDNIAKRTAELIKTAQENEKLNWINANPDYKKKGLTFTPTVTDASQLTGDAQTELGNMQATALLQYATSEKSILKSLLDKYQDYTAQKLELDKKYNEDVAQLQAAREQALSKGDSDMVSKIDRTMAKRAADYGKSAMELSFNQLKESPSYSRAFEDLKNTSTDTLNTLLKQLENTKQAAAESLNPADLKAYTDAIQNLRDELDSRKDPFLLLAERQRALTEIQRRLIESKKELDYVNSGGQIAIGSMGIRSSTKDNTIYMTSAQALEKYNKVKDEAAKASNEYVKAEKEVLSVVNDFGNSLKNVGDTLGGTAGEIISFMGDIVSFASTSMQGIQKMSSAASQAISAVEKASVILAIISAAIQLMQKLDALLGDAHSQYEKYAEKVGEINKLTDAVNDYRIAVIEANNAEKEWFGNDKLQGLKDYYDKASAAMQAYYVKLNEMQATYQNESAGGWGKYVSPVAFALNKIGNSYDESLTKAMDNLRIETRKKSSGFLGSGIGGKSQKTEDLVSWVKNQGLGDLFGSDGQLNVQLAQQILDKYGDKLVGETKATLETLVKYQEQWDEYITQLKSYVSDLYSPLVDNFVQAIWDWLDTGKDALDSFKEYASDTFRSIATDMIKTIVLEKLFNNEAIWGKGQTYQSRVAAEYEKYSKGEITLAQMNANVQNLTQTLTDNAKNQTPAIETIASAINDGFKAAGYDISSSSSSSQSATSKGAASLTQDTAEELNGRFTAMQISMETMAGQSGMQTEKLSVMDVKLGSMLTISSDIRNIADENRQLLAQSYLELVEIRNNTGDSAKSLKEIKAGIDNIDRNTKNL